MYHAPQVTGNGLCDMQDAVDVVWHGLEGDEFHLGMELGDVEPCLFDLSPEFGESDPGQDMVVVGSA